jgi:alpha-galactosidase
MKIATKPKKRSNERFIIDDSWFDKRILNPTATVLIKVTAK